MTHLEIIFGASAIISGIWCQWWIDRRQIKRAQAWAEHWHRKFMDCPRSIAVAAENGFEHGHKKGWEDCLDAIEHDKPATPLPITATITRVQAPDATSPTNLAAIEPPGELTLWEAKWNAKFRKDLDAALERSNVTLSLASATSQNRKDTP